MEDKGIREFQKQRYEIITNCITQSCLTLLEKGIHVSQSTVSQEVMKIFKNEKINIKYLVSEQTIGRNKQYNSIWKKAKRKQKETILTKREKKNKELEFSIRDKYDMLKQDYIELNDNYTYLLNENKKNIVSPRDQQFTKEVSTSKNSNDDLSSEIVISLKKLLIHGAVVIIQKDNSIVIKNLNLKDECKIIINKDRWDSI